ncbi:hypothetical protein GGI10_005387, partial [Coemansia sp. RSA 2530]
MDHNDTDAPGSEQQNQLLQPLFDSSVSLPRDGAKSSASRTMASSSPPESSTQPSNVFGRLPATSGMDNALMSHMPSSQSLVGGGGHGRTASYGTTLLDTLNEEKQQSSSLHYQRAAAAHQRHFSLMGD